MVHRGRRSQVKAKREKWPPWGALADEVRKEVETLLLEEEGIAAGVAPSEKVGIIETPPCETLRL
jgi:hypothetical protein